VKPTREKEIPEYSAFSALLLRTIKNWLGPFDDLEIRRDGEQRRVRLSPIDVRKLKRLVTHSWIAAFAIDNSLQVRRRPDLGNDLNGSVISDLAGGNRARSTHTID